MKQKCKRTSTRKQSSERESGGITVITPTGDRQLAFALCKRWMENQTRQPDQWIVIDDGKDPLTPLDGMTYIRRTPLPDDPPHTVVLNHRAALPKITGGKILIMEDDDYYAPSYIEEVASRLDLSEVVGICMSKYYHLPTGGYRIVGDSTHASLGQTAFRASFLPKFEAILSETTKPFVDMRVWKNVGSSGDLFVDEVVPLYLGIKGLPGRRGIGVGHRSETYGNSKDTGDRAMLKQWVPGDYQIYLDILNGKLTSENCGIGR